MRQTADIIVAINIICCNIMLVILLTGGLCNYLTQLNTWYSYAKSLRTQLIVIWSVTHMCNGFFLDYFEKIDGITFLRDNNENYDITDNGPSQPPSLDYPDIDYKFLKLKKYMIKIIKRRVKKLNGKNMGWKDVGRKYVNGKALKKKKIITSGLERKIIKKVKSGNSKNRTKVMKIKNKYNAVHIRRTDHIDWARRKEVLTTTDNEFNTFIKKNKNKNKNLYIATDDPKTYRVFKKRYRKNVKFKYHKINAAKTRKTSLRDAIIDIYMSVYSDQFMGSDFSSFSEIITKLRDIKNSN